MIKKTIKRGDRTYLWIERPKFDGSQHCHNIETDAFYPLSYSRREYQVRMLDKVCKDCPFKRECLEYAVSHEPYGFWGGTTPPEREVIRKETKLGLVPAQFIGEFFIYNNSNIGTQI